jgi:hypothetical protein
MLVSFSRHPFGAREMAIEGTAGALDIVIRVYVQYDPRNLAPVGTFRIGIQRSHIRDGVLSVVRREGALGRSNVSDVRVKGQALHGASRGGINASNDPRVLRHSHDSAPMSPPAFLGCLLNRDHLAFHLRQLSSGLLIATHEERCAVDNGGTNSSARDRSVQPISSERKVTKILKSILRKSSEFRPQRRLMGRTFEAPWRSGGVRSCG